MKIGSLDTKPVATPVTTERKGAATDTTAAAADTAEASAKVELSSTASSLGVEGSGAEFDTEKVNRIAQAIRDGKFQVNPEAIADKLISNAQEVISRTSH
jgi:negative regulator of flagellin synthesis FlgM